MDGWSDLVIPSTWMNMFQDIVRYNISPQVRNVGPRWAFVALVLAMCPSHMALFGPGIGERHLIYCSAKEEENTNGCNEKQANGSFNLYLHLIWSFQYSETLTWPFGRKLTGDQESFEVHQQMMLCFNVCIMTTTCISAILGLYVSDFERLRVWRVVFLLQRTRRRASWSLALVFWCVHMHVFVKKRTM